MSNTVVRTNVLALNSHRNLGLVSNMQARSSERLSSGFRINRAADDAAGLAISEGMRAQIRGMAQASRNTQDGISLVQTAEGFTNTIQEITQRVRELATQGANDTNDATQRGHINTELTQLRDEITRIHGEATFNGNVIFTDLLTGSFNLQIGPDGNRGSFDLAAAAGASAFNTAVTSATAAITTLIAADMSTGAHSAFRTLLQAMDTFNSAIGTFRANLGAIQNRLEFTIENLDIARENLSASESRIRDADMALEMMRLTQANVLQQAATAMLAQGNQAPQSVLQLLG